MCVDFETENNNLRTTETGNLHIPVAQLAADVNGFEELEEIEQERFDLAIDIALDLFKKENREWRERLIEDKLGYLAVREVPSEDNPNAAGYIKTYQGQIDKYEMVYRPLPENIDIFSLHSTVHEIVHLLSKRDDLKEEEKYHRYEKTARGGGLEIWLKGSQYGSYGKALDESMTDMMAMIAESNRFTNTNSEMLIARPIGFVETGYSLFHPIARLMTFAMDNQFDKVDYDTLLEKGIGVADYEINVGNKRMPLNDLMYSKIHDELHAERIFDKYSPEGEGAYKNVNLQLDNQLQRLIRGEKLNPSTLEGQAMRVCFFYSKKLEDYVNKGIISQETRIYREQIIVALYEQTVQYYNNLY